MKKLLLFKIASITEPSTQQKEKGIKHIVSFLEEIEAKNVKYQSLISASTKIELKNLQDYIGKDVVCEIQETVISNGTGKPNVYYQLKTIELKK